MQKPKKLKRTPIEIDYDLLKLLASGQKKLNQSKILRKVNLTHECFISHVNDLIKNKFIIKDEERMYKLTDAGHNQLNEINKFLESIK